MSIPVIHPFEAVYVHKDNCQQTLLCSLLPFQYIWNAVYQKMPLIEPSQRIMDRKLIELVDQLLGKKMETPTNTHNDARTMVEARDRTSPVSGFISSRYFPVPKTQFQGAK